ncbi:hypothetical protein SAMN05660199_01928 [Klenkia soli]|uniref:Uncharacterized protein n=1 Tax=Klenkia soli TaxID=1052260 RepID=A0A1H0JCN0_9ACTN|nr:hypothetical protein [Klenkia soli]SDO41111.1 hypothetical protein SAMN05660199_01928 [Klenkia soli]
MEEVAPAAEPEPMPVTGVALIAAAVLHAVVSVLVSIPLPSYVPIAFDLAREPVAAVSPGVLLLLLLVVPLVVAGGAAVVAVVLTRAGHPVRGDRLRHLAAVTLLMLTFEVAAVYGALGGIAVASWTGGGDTYPTGSVAVQGFQDAGGRLPTVALVVAAVYLAYLVTWAVAVRRTRAGVDELS